MLSLEQVKQGLESAGQSHVLQFWSELCETERDRFLQQLSQLDFEGLKGHCEEAAKAVGSQSPRQHQHLEPIPPESIGSVRKSDKGSLDEWENEGKKVFVQKNCSFEKIKSKRGRYCQDSSKG